MDVVDRATPQSQLALGIPPKHVIRDGGAPEKRRHESDQSHDADFRQFGLGRCRDRVPRRPGTSGRRRRRRRETAPTPNWRRRASPETKPAGRRGGGNSHTDFNECNREAERGSDEGGDNGEGEPQGCREKDRFHRGVLRSGQGLRLLLTGCHHRRRQSYGYGSRSVGVISLAEAVVRGTPSPVPITILSCGNPFKARKYPDILCPDWVGEISWYHHGAKDL